MSWPLLEKQLELFRSRVPMTRAEFDALAEAMRQQAFTHAYESDKALIQQIQGLMDQALKGDLTASEFREKATAKVGAFEDGSWAETVYRNNMAQGRAAGRYALAFSERRLRTHPYIMVLPVIDARNDEEDECPNLICRTVGNKLLRKDDPATRQVLVPLHHRCRCTTIELTEAGAKREGLTVTNAVTLDVAPPKGWQYDRVKALVPEGLRVATPGPKPVAPVVPPLDLGAAQAARKQSAAGFDGEVKAKGLDVALREREAAMESLAKPFVLAAEVAWQKELVVRERAVQRARDEVDRALDQPALAYEFDDPRYVQAQAALRDAERRQRALATSPMREELLRSVGVAEGRRGALPAPTQTGSRDKARTERYRDAKVFLEELLDKEVLAPVQRVELRKTRSRRAFALGDAINMAKSDSVATYVHELGHVIERAFGADGWRARAAFLRRRTAGEDAEQLRKLRPGAKYRRDEKAKPDKFSDPYTGKVYAGGSDDPSGPNSEVIAMGLEALYRDPAKLYREDPDFFRWLLRYLKGLA